MYQVVAGFKIVDPASIDPLTQRFIKPQSRNVCWPVKIALGKETKEMHTKHINPTRNWWDKCDSHNEDEDERINLHFPSMKAFNLCYTNDMSAGWKLTKKGG